MPKPTDDKQYTKAWNAANAPAVGGGMVKQAVDTLKSAPYRLHVQEAKAMGDQPMSPEEFAKAGK